MTKQLAIGSIELFKISESYLHELRNKQKPNQNIFNYLPKYSINKDYGHIVIAEHYHQFTGMGNISNEDFWFLNFDTTDSFLKEELHECGVEDMFKFDFRDILNNLNFNTENDLKCFVIPETHNLIVEINTSGGYNSIDGYVEFDVEYDIIGYFDKDMNKIIFD